jgi:hypothetical protein
MRNCTSWSDEDSQRLIELIDSGCSAARASVIFKRTVGSVQNRARKLGKPFPNRREARKGLLRKIAEAERGVHG